MKKTALFALIACGTLFSSFTAMAGEGGSGGNGVRGGSGVYCEGQSPKVLDYFLALQENTPAVEATLKRIAEKCDVSNDECFYSEVLAHIPSKYSYFKEPLLHFLQRYGRPTYWPSRPLGMLPFGFRSFETPLAKTLFYVYSHYGPRIFDGYRYSPEMSRYGIFYGPDTVFDDALTSELPPKCTSVQVAFVRTLSGSPELTFDGRFFVEDRLQARLLALHEAIYAVAATGYLNDSPRSTRDVFIKLLTGEDPTPAIEGLMNFVQIRHEFRSRSPFNAKLEKEGILYAVQRGSTADCPIFVLLGYDGKDGILAYEFWMNKFRIEMKIRSSSELSKDYESFSNCTFSLITLPDTTF